MSVLTFCAVGLCCSLALIIAAVTLTAVVVTVVALVRTMRMLGAILREVGAGERDRPRAVARDRWSNALRRDWK